MNKVICIGRQFGSGGHVIAKRVAEKMGIDYYDKYLIERAIEKSGLPAHAMEKADERTTPFIYEAYYEGNMKEHYGKSANDIMYEAQKELILEAADKGDCVVVGRCAHDIIRRESSHLAIHIFITAPMQYRINKVMEWEKIEEKQAAARIRKIDKARRAYYNYYTGGDWEKPSDYDMIFNSAQLGENNVVCMITEIAKKISVR